MLYFGTIILSTSLLICCGVKSEVLDVKHNNSTENQNLTQSEYEKPWGKIYFREILERLEGTKITNLRDLELPSNSKEIRIWAGFDTFPLRGLILKQNNEEWMALFLPPLDSSNALENSRTLMPPKNGWGSLWEKLNRLEIMTLPDPMDIGEIDGRGVVIEIKNGNSYRTYKYSGVNKETGDKYKKVLEICNTLSSEFDIELLKYFKPKSR